MSEELQEDGFTFDGPSEVSAEPNQKIESESPDVSSDAGSELATDNAEEREQNTEQVGSIDGVYVEGPEGFKKAINKKHFQAKEAERKAEALQKQLDELRAKQEAPKPAPVELPEVLDSWEDGHQQSLQAREEAIRHNATIAAQKAFDDQQAQNLQREKERQQVEHVQKLETDFFSNGDKLGVNKEGLTEAARIVGNYGISPDVAFHLMKDSDGPLLVNHLASNPIELDRLASMSPIDSGAYLATLKTSVASQKPKTPSAPAPADTISGKGATSEDPALRGMTFE